MKLKAFFFSLVIIFFYGSVIAQDSALARWQVSAERLAEGVYKIHYSGYFPKGYYLYEKNTPLELEGFKATMPDSSYVQQALEIKSPAITFKDPTFEADTKIYRDSFIAEQTLRINGTPPAVIRPALNYELGGPDNFVPEEQKTTINLSGGTAVAQSRIKIPTIDLAHPVNDCKTTGAVEETKSSGLLTIFLLGFAGGLVALLTPCVFPMIPLTVSFFTKRAQSRKAGIKNAFLYGFFIFFIYVLLSTPFHFLDKINPQILNETSTNPWLNIVFFVIFIVFALSFFGLYEITLPSKISNNTDSKAGVGSVVGIFFMALTLALVSFSCTGPILGSLLAGSLTADGGAMQLTAGMAGFGLALALPFALFALFPNLLQALPKSGGWLNTVKVVLGFVELAMALKFLSNADLVKHWGILKREVFIGIWVVIGALLTLYLFGLIRFPHDNKNEKPSFLRKTIGVIMLLFTLYLIPGLTNTKWANLKLISGFPPPLHYSIYQKDSECILNLNCTKDYETGLRMAREQNKPILLDFTGYACVNCRRMEENVWTDPEVYQVMKDNYIIVSLYVDDKAKLPAAEQQSFTGADGVQKEIITVGDKWATFETENFMNNAQPWYALISPDEKLLTHPAGYTPDKESYRDWLKCGVDAFNKIKSK